MKISPRQILVILSLSSAVSFITYFSFELESAELQGLFPSQFIDDVISKLRQRPVPLPSHQRNESVLLVHVGKAGGSAVRSLLLRAAGICQKKPQMLV
jgi:hypothetical protein